jgi:hypothetical protein
MKKSLLSAAFVLALSLPAFAADLPVKAVKAAPPPPPTWWEIAYGGAIMSDYNFRGVSQSDRSIAGTFYVEGRANIIPEKLQIYGGIQPWTTKLPTEPTGEFDFYGGIRPTFGPVAFDFGAIYYYYPRERQQFTDFATIVNPAPLPGLLPLTVADTDFWEVYGKVTWTVNDWLALGAYVYYSPDFLHSGADGTYAGGTVKITAPSTWFPTDFGAYVSGEYAHYWLGTTGATLGFVNLPDYNYWNLGVAFTYKIFTLDLRYHDTDLSRAQCFTLTGDPRGVFNGGFSRWCSEAFIAKLAIDTTIK